jgi:hypothetical protein
MSNREMLKEAIADAKTIKETAIANAKAALEESFTPHIKSMLAAKLQEMDKDEMKEAKDEIDEAKDKEKMDEADAVSYKRASSPAHNYSDGAVNPVPKKVGTSTIQEKEELDEEMDLDEMLAELDEEMAKDKKMDEAKDKELDEAKDKDLDEGYDKDLDEAEDEDMEADEEEVDMDDEEIDLEDMSEDDLKGFIEDVIKDMVSAGELEPGDEFESEEGEGEDEMEMDVDADIEITEEKDDMKEAKDEMDENVGPWKIRKKMEESDDLDEAKDKDLDEAKDKDLEEAVAELDELKKELQEVNLLNAKLLYTNKLFRAKNLSEAQKVKVLESFDKATSVKETKLVFETLNEGIKSKPVVNEVKGSASKATGIINESKQPIVESNDMVARFQKLAGIINN